MTIHPTGPRLRGPRNVLTFLTASCLAVTGCGGDGTGPGAQVVSTAVVAGDEQVMLRDGPLPAVIVVVGRDAAGNAVVRGDLPVSWSVTGGGGEIGAAHLATQPDGTARANWVLGPEPGEQTLEVSIAGADPAIVRAEAVEAGPIAFASSRDGGRWDQADAFVMNADGTVPVRLTARGSALGFVRWSPDGRALLYDRAAADGTIQLYKLELDGLVETQLTSLATADPRGIFAGGGDWSPDGARIAFSVKEGIDDCTFAATNIWVMNSDGTGLQRLTEGCGLGQGHPDWSPDGSRIAFQQNIDVGGGTAGGGGRVMIMDADGANLRTLVSPGQVPRWSPDGTRVLYAVDGSVRATDADGTDSEMLWTTPGAGVGMVAWSADGDAIVVSVYDDASGQTADIYRYDLTDGMVRNLTETAARDVGVDWRDGG